MAMAGAGFFIMMMYFVAIVGFFVFWIKSLIEVIKSEYEGQNTKIMWIILLVAIAPVATIAYQFIGKNQKLKA